MTDQTPKPMTFGHLEGKDVTHAIPAGTEPTSDRGTTVVALCRTRLSPSVVEADVDARAEKVAGVRVCGTCQRLIKEGKTEFPAAARGETAPSEPAKPAKPKANGQPRAALSKADEKRLSEAADTLSTGRGKLDRDAVVVVGRKLIKLHRGLRSSKPPVPSALSRDDLPRIVEALGLPETLLSRAADAAKTEESVAS